MHVRYWVLIVAIISSACGSSADVGTALQIGDVTTGWYDAGIVEGAKNKLVPMISFRLTNVSPSDIKGLQVNAVFRRDNEEQELGSQFVKADPIASKATTQPIVLRSGIGYTGTQPRAEMLQNKAFVDANVQLFAKHGSAQWVKIGEYRIRRQLLTS